MKKEERMLFISLCQFDYYTFDEKLLHHATPYVLGQLFFNRMQGIAYDVLNKFELIGKVNREFRNSLEAAYRYNLEKNHSFFKCVNYISDLLSETDCKVAMLKGAYLCAHYPTGYRTSNDIDLLVSPKDVTKIGNILSNAGFVQGKVKDGNFIPATRKEIIESKMMRGETVPYIKQMNLPYMDYLEVDINFSLDYKNGDEEILEDILSRVSIVEEKEIRIPTLDKSDFFIHLCAHLYKEATTLPWIKMNRDMTLYKYSDIHLLLAEMSNEDIQAMYKRAKELGMEKICAYTIVETMELFALNSELIYWTSMTILEKDPLFRFKVFSPEDKKTYYYEETSAYRRFFMEDRLLNLKEVKDNDKNENEGK